MSGTLSAESREWLQCNRQSTVKVPMSGRGQDQEEEGKKYRAGVNRKITKGRHAVSRAV